MAFGIYKLEFHGGAFGEGKKGAFYDSNTKCFNLPPKKISFFNRMEKVTLNQVESIQVADQESIKKMGATFGWGLAGLAIAGPLGAVAGLLGGGRAKKTTFLCILKDDRKFLATMDNKGFIKIQGDLL